MGRTHAHARACINARAHRHTHMRTHAHTGDRMGAHDGHDSGTRPFCAHPRCGAAQVRDARAPQQRSQRRYRCNRHTRPAARHTIMEETRAAWSVVVAGGLGRLLLPGIGIYVYVQLCVYADMCVPTEVHVCMCMRVCVCVYVCVCVHSLLLSALAVARLHSWEYGHNVMQDRMSRVHTHARAHAHSEGTRHKHKHRWRHD